MVDPHHPRLSIAQQCRLLSLARSSYYRQPASESPETLALMRAIDEPFLETPWYGSRQMARHLQRQDRLVEASKAQPEPASCPSTTP